MSRQMNALWNELYPGTSCPVVDAAQMKRRVNAALNAVPSERKLYMKQKIKMAAVLVAAAVALTGTALAVAPTLREMIAQALGSFAPYAQVVEGVTATDQGIEIKVSAAVADDIAVKVFLEVRDLRDSRINGDDLLLDIDARRGKYDCGYGSDYVSYDSETRTAIYALKFEQAGLPMEVRNTDRPLTLEISKVQPGYHSVSCSQTPLEFLTDATLDSKLLDGGERVLLPGLTPAELENAAGITLSSIGFASDGLLHIQIKLPKDVREEQNHIRFDIQTDNDFDHFIRYNDETTVFFDEGKDSYMDFKYSITRADIGDFEISQLYGSFHTADEISGEWNLTVPLVVLPKRVLTINQPIGGTMVKAVSLTAISATVEKKNIPGEKAHYAIPGLPLTLYRKDGSVVPVKDKYGWIFDQAIDPDEVTAIAIGMWYIPLEGDTALPGYWLEKLPE